MVLHIKRYVFLIMSVICLLGLGGCEMTNFKLSPPSTNEQSSLNCNEIPDPTPNTQHPSIMINNTMYYMTGRSVTIDANEEDYYGVITSVVASSEKPTKNGQANIAYEGAPYVEYQDGFALLMYDEWIYFEARVTDV